MHRESAYLLSLLFLSLILLVPVAHATQQYIIPLLGLRWRSYTIGVSIPTEPTWAHDTVLEAMEIWNHAQEWFTQKYYPNDSKTYIFKESQSSQTQITILFGNTYNAAYGGYMSPCEGRFGYCDHVKIVIVLKDSEKRDLGHSIIWTAMHEFGHSLGLGHPTSENMKNDLMWSKWNDQYIPSTLDLYAVYVRASGRAVAYVTLPTNIPYEVVPESAVPEFPYAPVLLLTVISVSLVTLRQRDRRLLRQGKVRLG